MLWSLALAATPFPDLLTPPDTAAPTSDAAVVIGLEDYGFLPDVPYARRDAMAVRTLLVTRLGMAPDRVRMLTAANREQMLSAIDASTAQVGPGGKLVIWFSGHGATSPTDGSMMLVGDDAKPQPDAFSTRSLSVAELGPHLPADALLVIDACAAGQGRDGQQLLPGARFAVPSYAASEPGLRVWTAASPTELAEPYPAAEHGLFTAFAVGALRGWGDTNKDGLVGLDEAQDYVQRAMVSVGARQSPTLTGPDLILAPSGETGPALATLPRLGAPAPSQNTEGTDEDNEDDGPLTQAPYSFSKGMFIDAADTRVSMNMLLTDNDTPSLHTLQKKRQNATIVAASGVGIVGLSALASGYISLFHLINSTSGLEAGNLGHQLAIPLSAAGLGTGMVIGGALSGKRKRKRILEEVNR